MAGTTLKLSKSDKALIEDDRTTWLNGESPESINHASDKLAEKKNVTGNTELKALNDVGIFSLTVSFVSQVLFFRLSGTISTIAPDIFVQTASRSKCLGLKTRPE